MFRASDGLGNWRQALCLFVSTDSKLILAMYFAIWLCFIMNLVNFFISMNNWLNILSLIWCPDACKTNLVTHFWCDWAHMEKERSVKGSFYDNKWEQCKFAPLSPPRTDHLKITCIWLFMRVLSVIVSNSAWTITSHFKDDLLFMWMKCWLLYCMSSWKNKIFFYQISIQIMMGPDWFTVAFFKELFRVCLHHVCPNFNRHNTQSHQHLLFICLANRNHLNLPKRRDGHASPMSNWDLNSPHFLCKEI